MLNSAEQNIFTLFKMVSHWVGILGIPSTRSYDSRPGKHPYPPMRPRSTGLKLFSNLTLKFLSCLRSLLWRHVGKRGMEWFVFTYEVQVNNIFKRSSIIKIRNSNKGEPLSFQPIFFLK